MMESEAPHTAYSTPEGVSPERLRRYLPFNLYNELILKPSPEILKQCLEHLTALLQTVRTYCSAPILAEAQPDPHHVQGRWCEATLLFADISGFTAMSERLSVRGRAGAEEITRVVNMYFTAMVDVLHRNGGALIKFGGDALLGLFVGHPRHTVCHAVQAALEMQQAMVRFAEVETLEGRFELQMKVGLHTGQVFAAHVGTASQMEYWVTGDDVNLTALAEEGASRGQVVISEVTRRHLSGCVDVELLSDCPALYQVLGGQELGLESQPVVRETAVPHAVSKLACRLDTLVPYLPIGLLPRLVYNPHSRRVEGEHRLIAVLFVNVVGFSELATALGPARPDPLVETMQDYLETMQSIVQRHGGTINKTDLYSTGDKLLVIFGAPIAHEDDVDQAARAAVAMQVALEEVNRRLAVRCPSADIHLCQRIGLSTGYVFSGNVGSEVCQEYTIMGDEVNLAARLMSAALWGDILVSSHVFYWLEPFGTFEPGGVLSLKGKRNPVHVYRLDAMGETHRPKPPFVDREQAQAMLRGYLDGLVRGQGRIVSLVGEPGIGKSRLLGELQLITQARGVLWLAGGCRERQVAYHLVASLLRDYLRLEPADDPEAQRRVLVQKIGDLFGPDLVAQKGPFLSIVMDLPLPDEWRERVEFLGEHLSERVAQETADFFERLTEDRPLMLVCDDLHWLDDGSADALIRLLELVEYAPIMFAFTLRPGQYLAYGQVAGVAMTRFFNWHTQILLEPLSTEDTAQVAAAILGQDAPPELQERIYQRSQGNPLFICEIVRVTITAPGVSIPDRVQKIIESRVDALPEGPRRTIKAAAVAGSQFTLPELVHVLDEREQDVRRSLAVLRRMQMVDIREKGYAFVHPLAWEAIYDEQNERNRRASHRRLGQYWVAQANPQKAGHHYFAAELWDQALEQSERAADRRREAYAYEEAIRLYRQALGAAERLGDLAAQSRLINRLGQVYYRSGNYEQAVQAHQKELNLLLNQSAGALAQAEVHCALGRVCDHWGRYEQALDEMDRGLELAGPEPSVTRARLLVTRCSVLINIAKLEEAERDGLESLQIAQAVRARPEESYACNNLGAVYGTLGRYGLALEYHQRSLAARRELGVAYDIAQSLVNVGTALNCLGRFDEAEASYQEALELQQRIGARRYEGHTHHNMAWLHWDRGELGAAEEAFLRALSLWDQIDHRRGVAFVHNDLGTLYLEQGRLEEARSHLEKSAQLYEAMGAHTYLPENYIGLARVYAELGEADALTAAQRALDWAQGNKDRRREAMACQALAEIYLAKADLARAEHYARHGMDLAQAEPVLADQLQAAQELLEKINQE